MTTPPITRRCPFCAATTEHMRIGSEAGKGKGVTIMRVECMFCWARGPGVGYRAGSSPGTAYAMAACVFDWNCRDGIKSWANEDMSNRRHSKRVAFIAKWARACKD